jgi:hypothetical protein
MRVLEVTSHRPPKPKAAVISFIIYVRRLKSFEIRDASKEEEDSITITLLLGLGIELAACWEILGASTPKINTLSQARGG